MNEAVNAPVMRCCPSKTLFAVLALQLTGSGK
jgi:hypothetical protein